MGLQVEVLEQLVQLVLLVVVQDTREPLEPLVILVLLVPQALPDMVPQELLVTPELQVQPVIQVLQVVLEYQINTNTMLVLHKLIKLTNIQLYRAQLTLSQLNPHLQLQLILSLYLLEFMSRT